MQNMLVKETIIGGKRGFPPFFSLKEIKGNYFNDSLK